MHDLVKASYEITFYGMIILGDGLNNMKNQDAQHIKNINLLARIFKPSSFPNKLHIHVCTYNLEETFAKIYLPD